MTTASADDYIRHVLERMPRATPMRAQIATELRGHIAERVGSGHSVEDVLRHLGDPETLAESYLAAVPLVSAPFWRRAIAKGVDVLTVLLVVAPAPWLIWRLGNEALFPFAVLIVVVAGSLLFGLYTVIAEWWIGETLGKRLLDIRVVRESGARIGGGQAIVRQLPMFLQFYWVDILFALFTERSQRAFELLSKTRVVLVSPPR